MALVAPVLRGAGAGWHGWGSGGDCGLGQEGGVRDGRTRKRGATPRARVGLMLNEGPVLALPERPVPALPNKTNSIT